MPEGLLNNSTSSKAVSQGRRIAVGRHLSPDPTERSLFDLRNEQRCDDAARPTLQGIIGTCNKKETRR
jgi:hypothetical protein